METPIKKSIINCHTHIFTSKTVPPYLAKSFLPGPFYKIINTDVLMGINEFLKFDQGKWKVFYEKWLTIKIKTKNSWYIYRTFLDRNVIVKTIATIINLWFVIHALYYLLGVQILALVKLSDWLFENVKSIFLFLESKQIFLKETSFLNKAIIILFVFFFIEIGRKTLWTIARYLLPYLKLVPDSKTLKFLSRYLHIIRFAGYKESSNIYSNLMNQYDQGTGFVVLPMDMHYMGAGKIKDSKGSFECQMEELVKLKKEKNIYPFVFIDPRRIKDQSDFLKISGNAISGNVTLGDCLVKKYIETDKLNGFKIYPALGYYPFDEELLLLWKYAADHQIPIMTHVIKGTVFYRDKKETKWDYHPVFEQSNGENQATSPLMLPELKNIDFSINFTHPLNYLCLLEERLLRKILKHCREEIKDFFGYTDDNTELRHNLSNLKVCMGHYGGDDEWARYQERDRWAQVSNMLRKERDGFNFFPDKNNTNELNLSYLGFLWRSMDWFSVITNLMYKYDNVYADISYIIYNPTIYPLLKQVLRKDELKDRVLYGTDFFVVRNHKSEKQLLSEVMANLSDDEFDLIARENPRSFLKTSYFEIL